jgi:HK97 family phage portal protein
VLPDLTSAVKGVAKGFLDLFNSDPIQLGLKATVEVGGASWYAANGYPGIAASLGGGSSAWSGESVTNETALNHSVVWCCRRIISESVGGMPLELMQAHGESREPAKSHPLYRVMHDEPNSDMSDLELRELLTDRTVAGGNSYGKIIRRSGTGVAVELWPITPSAVTIDRDKQQHLIYVVKDSNAQSKTYTVERDKPHDILHIRGLGSDGVRGFSVLTMARHSIGTAIAAERNVAGFYRAGGRLPYNLKINQKWAKTEDADKFRADWEAIYSQPHRAPILEPWVEYQQTGLSAHDAQLLETRQFGIPELCRWFLITPHMVGDLSHGTFSNIENLYLQHLKGALNGWITREEKAFKRCLLTPEEKAQGYYFKHNVNALLRGDFATRMAGYATALQNGFKNIDEVKALEDENPLPNGAGKAYHIQLNMATVPGTGKPMVTEQGILNRMAATAKPPAADTAKPADGATVPLAA